MLLLSGAGVRARGDREVAGDFFRESFDRTKSSQLDDVKSITLSYTYFRAKGGNESLASLDDLVSEH